MSKKRILMPVDIHYDSSELLRFAGNIANNIQGRLNCVSVMSVMKNSKNLSSDSKLRRFVEIEMAKATTGIFKYSKPEYNIIVTKGDFASRLLSMVRELNIDLIIASMRIVKEFTFLFSELDIPLILFNFRSERIDKLVFPINLDVDYFHKIQKGIDVAILLGSYMKIIGHGSTSVHSIEYNEKLVEIKKLIEKENVACTVAYDQTIDIREILLSFDENLSESILLTHEDFHKLYFEASENDNSYFSSVTILPYKKQSKLRYHIEGN
jgi:hypothetical protein